MQLRLDISGWHGHAWQLRRCEVDLGSLVQSLLASLKPEGHAGARRQAGKEAAQTVDLNCRQTVECMAALCAAVCSRKVLQLDAATTLGHAFKV